MSIYCLICKIYSAESQRAVSLHARYAHNVTGFEYQKKYLGKLPLNCLGCGIPTKYVGGGKYSARCGHCAKIHATRAMQSSPEARRKMSLAKLGKPSPNKGIKMSSESCEKMSISHSLRCETHGVPLNMSYKGLFKPRNVAKYRGNWKNIVFRSLWERQVMTYLDEQDAVIEWSSEEIIIPYFDPIKGRRRRYFPDFWIKVQKPDGTTQEYMWEVKPSRFAVAPDAKTNAQVLAESKAKRRRYITEVMAYGTNEAKWKAARAYCEARGWKFQVVTEKELPSMNRRPSK